ncbi:Protein of unknown function DUF467 [Lachnospiraceae bacterium TWA4]|nr:Protein of unknown function DUF467 [Lachnospiraceae bacterium TWA4]
MFEKLMTEDLSEKELKKFILNIHEKYYIEMKKANELPKAFWETYSSFCNTSGGIIVLGVEEGTPQNKIIGVGNPEKILSSLWDQLSNTNKVNFNNINNEDVHTYTIDEKTIIIIHVKEVSDSIKPVYINNKIEDSWIRTGDGDRKVTKDQLATLFRNANPILDSIAADNFTMDDLDTDSVLSYKERVNKRYPKKEYIKMENDKFLLEIGACFRDRTNGEFKIKRGTLLFLGKCNAIKELYPHYHVDYFNKSGNNPRWSDRVSDDELGDYEMNLYNFFSIVYEKMKALLQQGFSLDEEQARIPMSNLDETIRECLVNCLAHADYAQGYPSIKIEVYNGWFRFTNPGKMLVSTEQFFNGGDSRPRNEIIMKLFRLMGISERQGFGGCLIYKTAMENDLRRPEILTDIEHTEIKIWHIDLADSYPNLSNDEKNVFRYIVKSHKPLSIRTIGTDLNITEYKMRKIIPKLVEFKLIEKIGTGSATKYQINFQSAELLTKLQVAVDNLKKCLF